LRIERHDVEGGEALALGDGSKAVFVLLKIRLRLELSAKNCRIEIRRIEKRGPVGGFTDVPMFNHLQLFWSPADDRAWEKTVCDGDIIELGRLVNDGEGFRPGSRWTPIGFSGNVKPNETIRYHLRAIAEDVLPSGWEIFEVSWDGQWDDHLQEMWKHLQVRKVEPP
jgi:hypothetical protein